MIDRNTMATLLEAALPPATMEQAPPKATTLRQAARNMEREANLLIEQARLPMHETLSELAERMR